MYSATSLAMGKMEFCRFLLCNGNHCLKVWRVHVREHATLKSRSEPGFKFIDVSWQYISGEDNLESSFL